MPAALRPLRMTQIVTSARLFTRYAFLHSCQKSPKAMTGKGFGGLRVVIGLSLKKLARKLL